MAGFTILRVVLSGKGIRIRLDGGDAERVALEGRRKLAAGGWVQHVLGRARPIGAHSVAIPAAEQRAHRDAQNLARQVPQGDFHAADRGHGYSCL